MILNNDEIEKAGIVSDAVPTSRRSTTYDATIGEFIQEGECFEGDTFKLKPRGIVWVVSKETFMFGPKQTGLATLKTTLTHKGILALNVGIIDPGWDGPLATALVNFSGTVVSIKRGDPFFRVLFMSHKAPTNIRNVRKERIEYTNDMVGQSRLFSSTFLDMHSLVRSVAEQVFSKPQIGLFIAVVALVFALAAIVIPLGLYAYSDQTKVAATMTDLERRVEKLEGKR